MGQDLIYYIQQWKNAIITEVSTTLTKACYAEIYA